MWGLGLLLGNVKLGDLYLKFSAAEHTPRGLETKSVIAG
jgi:hypothetical protein